MPGPPSGGLVGRDDEVGRLRRLVAEVAAGRGRSVWVEGEPGVGKTAVMAAGLAGATAAGCQLYWEPADQARGRFPLWVLLDCLRVGRGATDPLRLEIARLLRGEGTGDVVAPADVTTAVAERLLVLVDRLCADSPVVLVVDDLQWADEASLRLWERLHRLVGQLPLLLVAVSRPVPVRPEAAALRESVTGGDCVLMDVGPLPPDRVVELVAQLAGTAPGPRLTDQARRAGGNPLYVRELVDALLRDNRVRVDGGVAELVGDDGSGPGSLAGVIAGRLRFLPERTAGVLRFAALLGPEFSVEDLAVLTGRPTADLTAVLAEAVAAGVLTGSGKRLLFRHGLIHQALYERMPIAMRVALHRQAAQALAGAGAPAEQVAEHLLAAPGAVDTWTAEWVAGAAQALIYRAPQVAVELLERVRGSAAAPVPVDVSLVTALFLLGRYDEVPRLAGPVLVATADPIVTGRMAWALAFAQLRKSQYDQALTTTGEVLAGRALTPVWTARMRALRAVILNSSARHAEAAEVAAQAELEGERAGDRLAVGYALHTLAMLRIWQDRDDWACLDLIDRALAVVGDQPEATDLRLSLLGNRMAALANLGRTGEADPVVGEMMALAEQAGTPAQLARMRLRVSDHYFGVGRWDDALAELGAAVEALRPDAIRSIYLHAMGALIAAHRDDRTAYQRHVRAVDHPEAATGLISQYAELLQLARAVAAERDGQPQQALDLLLSVVDPRIVPAGPSDLPAVADMLLPDLVRLLLDAGDYATAGAAAELCEADAEHNPLPPKQAAATHCRGLVDADPAVLLAAAEEYYKLNSPLYRGLALENAAVLLAGAGDAAAARAAYADAIEVYETLDAAWDVRRADTRLRALGVRRGHRGPRQRPASGWDALTPAELNVAVRVAQGYSNPDIAADLFLSRRTVQSHVSHVLAKLDAQSRVDIARAYAERRRAS
jgi:DNA-binding CsgD family transcriptional regulator